MRASIAGAELMLHAAEAEDNVGWRACALATRASERLRLGDIDIAEYDANATLRDLVSAEATLASGACDPISEINARVGIGVGYPHAAPVRAGLPAVPGRIRAADEIVTALVVDMDKLKLINDTHGHAAGDQAVRAVAAGLRADARDGDTVARLGGDEFGAVLPGADPQAAATIAARMLDAVRGIPNCLATVSLGVASGPAHALIDTVARADQAMYVAKRAGGDAVCNAPARAPPSHSAMSG